MDRLMLLVSAIIATWIFVRDDDELRSVWGLLTYCSQLDVTWFQLALNTVPVPDICKQRVRSLFSLLLIDRMRKIKLLDMVLVPGGVNS